MNQEDLRKTFMRTLDVPSLPVVVKETLGLINGDQAGTRQIGAKIAEDPPLTIKLLRIANSALYGSKSPILSPEHAAAVLGFDALRNMLMHASVFDLFAHLETYPELDLKVQWRKARICAKVARDLPGTWAEDLNREDAYLCGLLHNIGVFVLLNTLGEEYIAVLETHRRTGRPLKALELESIQLSHDQVGFLVARRWQLPKALLESIRYHLESKGSIERSPAAAVTHVARVVTELVMAGRRERASRSVPSKLLKLIGLDSEALDNYAEHCQDEALKLEA